MFSLEYTLSRNFRGRWFTPLVLVGAVLSIAVLTVVNVALTGYETITVFKSDFNATQSFWYDYWLPGRATKPGTLCDPHIFNIGDSFTTNYQLFQWTIESISKTNAGDSGIVYTGTTLEDCDVSSLYLNGDMRSHTLDVTGVVSCRVRDEFEVNANTRFSITALPGNHSPLLGVLRTGPGIESVSSQEKSRGVYLDVMTQLAGMDISNRMVDIIKATNNQSPIIISAQADFPPCPASLGTKAPCALEPPPINITHSAVVYPNTRLFEYDTSLPNGPDNRPVIDNGTFTPISNLIQTFYAALRIDLGNSSPNNIFLNTSVLNTTLFEFFPATSGVPSSLSYLYYANAFPETLTIKERIPLPMEGPAHVQVVYLCRFQRRKAFGQAFISVLVATLSMFSSGWAVFMLIATYFAKRNNDMANRCEGHSGQHSDRYMDPVIIPLRLDSYYQAPGPQTDYDPWSDTRAV